MRDSNGDINAFATTFGVGTNNQAELQSAIFGLQWCTQHGYRRIILEVKSELLTKWVKHSSKYLQDCITDLQGLIRQVDFFTCTHVYREANYIADALSKKSHQLDIPKHYYVQQQLPKEARGYFNMDKLNLANFRRRQLKGSGNHLEIIGVRCF